MNPWRLLLAPLLCALPLAGVCVAQEAPPPPAVAPELDPFKDVRRSDGTLRWGELLQRGGEPGPRLANFSLETFLRELTQVVKAGDRARTREFFDGVIATDFYTTYGVFAITSTAVELGYDMAYRRYLHRYVSPRIASGMLRTNLALSTGIALAELVNGDLGGKSFAISLGSLGISSALVEAGASRIPALRRFKLAIKGKNASKLLRTGGFVYQTAELALVFFVGRLIEERYYAVQSAREAHLALEAASATALAALTHAGDAAAAEACLRTYEAAWTDYRNALYAPLLRDQQVFLSRLSELAEEAKLADDRVQEALARAARYPKLPVAEFLEHQASEADAKFQHELDALSEVYLRDASEHFGEIYKGRRAPSDPFAPALALARSESAAPQAGGAFRRAHRRASRNRLQSYAQEQTALEVCAALSPQHAAAIAAAGARVAAVRKADEALAAEGSPLSLLGLAPGQGGLGAALQREPE
ncbi:MAG: hypothetical protein KDD82_30660 [Planctomycetes bacterium]|nr:hypothetical protein [Planctomycetota bacterium]